MISGLVNRARELCLFSKAEILAKTPHYKREQFARGSFRLVNKRGELEAIYEYRGKSGDQVQGAHCF